MNIKCKNKTELNYNMFEETNNSINKPFLVTCTWLILRALKCHKSREIRLMCVLSINLYKALRLYKVKLHTQNGHQASCLLS